MTFGQCRCTTGVTLAHYYAITPSSFKASISSIE